MLPEMKLRHYRSSPMVFDPDRKYVQKNVRAYGKPVGLWVSVEGEDDWPSWCWAEDFNVEALEYQHEVKLAPGYSVRMISSSAELEAFQEEYLEGTQRFDQGINWSRVAAENAGLIIAPYLWESRLDVDWYYGWDCASGCIWNLGAIESITPMPADWMPRG